MLTAIPAACPAPKGGHCDTPPMSLASSPPAELQSSQQSNRVPLLPGPVGSPQAVQAPLQFSPSSPQLQSPGSIGPSPYLHAATVRGIPARDTSREPSVRSQTHTHSNQYETLPGSTLAPPSP